MVKVSIIVPVYEVEKYLKRCLDSLITQTLENIEIILIDDASLDNSAVIMREYEMKYSEKIHCFYLKENIKQGGARNIGIKAAKGEFVLFVDSDDWIDSTMCEKMYQAAKETDSDIVFCDYLKIWEDTGVEKYIMEAGKEISGELTADKIKELLSMNAFPFSKMIRRELIERNHLCFAEKIKYEDQSVVPFFFLYAAKADKINEAYYFYNVREASTMHSNNNIHHFERMEAVLMFYDRVKEKGFYEVFKEEIDMFFIRSYCFYMLECCVERFNEPPIDRMQEITGTMRKICPNYLTNYYADKIIDPKYLSMAILNEVSPEKLLETVAEHKKQTYSYLKYYEETKARAQLLLSYCKEHHYKIALWGAGRKGTDFLNINDARNENIAYIIDENPDKKGKVLPSGHFINLFENIKTAVDVVLVSNRYYYGDVYKAVRDYNKEIPIINLDLYLTYSIDIAEYFK